MFEISILSSFAAGILSFISPCILPLVPVYLGIMSRNAISKGEKIKLSDKAYTILNSILFFLGFSIIFILLGSTATFIGQLLKNYLSIFNRIGGIILIIFGIHYTGIFKIRFLNFEKRIKMPETLKTGYLWSFLFGIIFSFGWVPCVGMILSGILLLASNMETFYQGIILLIVFSLGLGLPFIVSSIFISFFVKILKRVNKYLNIISIISGIFLIALGLIFVTNSMLKIISFMMAKIPFLSRINF